MGSRSPKLGNGVDGRLVTPEARHGKRGPPSGPTLTPAGQGLLELGIARTGADRRELCDRLDMVPGTLSKIAHGGAGSELERLAKLLALVTPMNDFSIHPHLAMSATELFSSAPSPRRLERNWVLCLDRLHVNAKVHDLPGTLSSLEYLARSGPLHLPGWPHGLLRIEPMRRKEEWPRFLRAYDIRLNEGDRSIWLGCIRAQARHVSCPAHPEWIHVARKCKEYDETGNCSVRSHWRPGKVAEDCGACAARAADHEQLSMKVQGASSARGLIAPLFQALFAPFAKPGTERIVRLDVALDLLVGGWVTCFPPAGVRTWGMVGSGEAPTAYFGSEEKRSPYSFYDKTAQLQADRTASPYPHHQPAYGRCLRFEVSRRVPVKDGSPSGILERGMRTHLEAVRIVPWDLVGQSPFPLHFMVLHEVEQMRRLTRKGENFWADLENHFRGRLGGSQGRRIALAHALTSLTKAIADAGTAATGLHAVINQQLPLLQRLVDDAVMRRSGPDSLLIPAAPIAPSQHTAGGIYALAPHALHRG